MSHDSHHEHIISELATELAPLLSKSSQAIYLYLDDEHKICNQKFADMLGYKSIEEWVENLYPISDVDETDQDTCIKAYIDASEKFNSSTITGTLVTKTGKKLKKTITFVPISYKGEVFVLHFIS